MTWTRLRQIALVASDLDAALSDLGRAFGLEVAYRDPAVAAFGLVNAVLPIGTQFVEVVSPTREGTAAGRQLERLGGDGGYMVICHTDDHPRRRRRVDDLGVRVAFEAADGGYRIMQLHPADTGGTFLEVDYQPGGEDPWGPWNPAGSDWQRASRGRGAISAVTVASADPGRTARRWSEILEIDLDAGGRSLTLDNAGILFVAGPVETLAGVVVTGTGLEGPVTICGVQFSPG